MRLRELLLERRKVKKAQMSYTCSVDAFRRNARRLEREGMSQSAAFAQAYAVLAFACERAKREAGQILIAPKEDLSLNELAALVRGLAEQLKNGRAHSPLSSGGKRAAFDSQ